MSYILNILGTREVNYCLKNKWQGKHYKVKPGGTNDSNLIKPCLQQTLMELFVIYGVCNK